jgi:Polysaccharide pyruvyl transferase
MIGLLDTSISSNNIGDKIIVESIKAILKDIGIEAPISLPTHEPWKIKEFKHVKGIKYWILCGTNALNSHHFFKVNSQWRLNLSQVPFLRNKVIGLGLGWWQYQGNLDFPTALLYRTIFKDDFLHSMREDYAVKKFERIGINSAFTSCPTMWNLPSRFDARRDGVVTAVTFYRKDKKSDKQLFDLLREVYGNVMLFAQSAEDIRYIKKLSVDLGSVLTNLEEFREKLQEGYGYLGTRLHAGIYALQHGRQAIVVAKDNRAIELSRGTNLQIVLPENLTLESVAFSKKPGPLKIPYQNILNFKVQLAETVSS